MSPLVSTAAAALPVLLVWAAAVDTLTRSIPNAVVVVLAAGFAAFAALAGLPAVQVLAHLVCACAVLAAAFVLFDYSLLGGGDAKLLAAAALWFGFETILPFLASVGLAGGFIALVYIAAGAVWNRSAKTGGTMTVPYGAAIAAGALAVLPEWAAHY